MKRQVNDHLSNSGRPARTFNILLCLAALLAASAAAQRTPEIAYVYPAGTRLGATAQLALAGRFLDNVSGAVISGGGVNITVVEHVKPLNGREINLLRDRLKELQDQLAPPKPAGKSETQTTTDPPEKIDPQAIRQEMADIRKKLANPKNQNRENPQLAEDLVLSIEVSPDAAPGRRELRVRTPAGLSNPIAFHVGTLPEYNEKEPNEKPADTDLLPALPLVINGQVLPGDVDRFRIRLAKDTHLVVRAQARDLIPYLADGVPGWFQATLALYDSDGKEVAYVDDYNFHPDPVIACRIPADGEYVIEIKDAIYRGREDFVYRITAGQLPFITSIFPLGGTAGAQTTVELKGHNLPKDKLTIDPKARTHGTLPVSLTNDGFTSNAVPFAIAALPECLEEEPNDRLSQARQVNLPVIVNGRIDKPGDCDVFSFEAAAGDTIVAEVHARRLDSPLDSILKLTDARGRTIAANDDHEDIAAGLVTHHADSLINATLPADGKYFLHVADAQQKGGPEYGYRLRISHPQPDFELRIVPSTLNVRAGATANITVHAVRKDGFTDAVSVRLKDAPKGFTLTGGRIPANKDEARMQLRAPAAALKQPVTLVLEGVANIGDRQIIRRALPADKRMQAFFYWHLVLAQDFKVTVLPRPGPARAVAAAVRQAAAGAAKPPAKPVDQPEMPQEAEPPKKQQFQN